MNEKIILPERQLSLTVPQLLFTQSRHKHAFLEWGRGGGKSTVIGWRVKDLVNHLPRAKIGIVGSTFQQLLTRTLPSTVEGLELLGYKRDLHYFVGGRPPKNWNFQTAYQPPLSYDNYISFYNGCGFPLISLDNPDSGRGLNLDGGLGDEAALFDRDKLAHSLLLSIRGNLHRFNKTPEQRWLHQSLLFASTTPLTTKGKWFTDQELEAEKDPQKILYMIASSLYNAHNLGAEYFRTMKRLLTDLTYNAEIMCIRPGRVATGFYPSFRDTVHCYEASNDSFVLNAEYNLDILRGHIPDADVNPRAPLDIACDYNAAINTMVIGQEKSVDEYRVLRGLHVKQPDTITELAQKFCKTYADHICKVVNFYYDHTANAGNAASPVTFAQQVQSVLVDNGWEVNMIYVGQAPFHGVKYAYFDMLFREQEPQLPRIRFNQENCKHLILSVQYAGARTGTRGIEKDKRPEQKKNVIHEEATHYSDAMDTLLYFALKNRLGMHGYYTELTLLR